MRIRPTLHELPALFPSPFDNTPHPLARAAAEELMAEVRTYMDSHPESELHRRGKMFGVLVYQKKEDVEIGTLRAFSAMLDGSYWHEGFVPPVYEVRMDEVVGTNRDDSRCKQQWLFSQYRFLNALGEEKNLLDIFRDAPPILSIEEYFARDAKGADSTLSSTSDAHVRIPSGAGECCAPKLLQEAYHMGVQPLCMTEFWMGASPKDELRIEGQFYGACTGKCKPILAHALRGLNVADSQRAKRGRQCATETRTLYEDDYLIAVSKPSGLLSVPGKEDDYCLLDYLIEQHHCTFYPVHRLDQDTSGIIVFAKTAEIATTLQKLFLRRDIHKVYFAELESTIPEGSTEGLITLPLLPNPLDRPRQMVHLEHGKPAITHYTLLDRIGPHGGRMVELRPATGRTHQLRVHCAHPDGLNAPIYGDPLYGSTAANRLMLHAAELSFPHPVSGEHIELQDRIGW